MCFEVEWKLTIFTESLQGRFSMRCLGIWTWWTNLNSPMERIAWSPRCHSAITPTRSTTHRSRPRPGLEPKVLLKMPHCTFEWFFGVLFDTLEIKLKSNLLSRFFFSFRWCELKCPWFCYVPCRKSDEGILVSEVFHILNNRDLKPKYDFCSRAIFWRNTFLQRTACVSF